ncbi:MAG TPA: cytochrome c biogenesis protein CcdA [Gemmatimonadales bacterium]|nr:cytochrome c biogenesis protein CcdA [Gemmatimonadales bacterium]
MNPPVTLDFGIAFLGGLLSFLSPCVLPLVPSYLGFLTGMNLDEMEGKRWLALSHAVCFVIGFSLVFLALGASATALGFALRQHQGLLQKIGGVLIIVFGLVCLGVIKMPSLMADKRVHLADKPLGYLGSVLVGMTFAAGWTPCIGPVLGGVLGLASSSADVHRGLLLLGAYSAGLAVPFLIAAWALGSFLAWFQKFRKYLPWVMRLSGALLVLVGILMVTGQFTRLATWMQGLTPEFLRERL